MTIYRANIPGIFPHLVSQAAFIDKVRLQVYGTRRTKSIRGILAARNLAIGGRGRFYARCIRGRTTVTGNSLEFKFGVMRRFPRLSPFVLSLWAHHQPVTCASVQSVADMFMRQGYRASISALELTFDVGTMTLHRFVDDLCSRARVFRRVVDSQTGSITHYVGGAASPWQVRLYQKTSSIARVEFILRSTCLRQLGIRRPQDLLRLRRAELWQRVGFKKVSHDHGDALPTRLKKRWIGRGFLLPPAMPASIIQNELRKEHLDPSRWIVRSETETLLREMQRMLVW